jgi:hypothetical protein
MTTQGSFVFIAILFFPLFFVLMLATNAELHIRLIWTIVATVAVSAIFVGSY